MTDEELRKKIKEFGEAKKLNNEKEMDQIALSIFNGTKELRIKTINKLIHGKMHWIKERAPALFDDCKDYNGFLLSYIYVDLKNKLGTEETQNKVKDPDIPVTALLAVWYKFAVINGIQEKLKEEHGLHRDGNIFKDRQGEAIPIDKPIRDDDERPTIEVLDTGRTLEEERNERLMKEKLCKNLEKIFDRLSSREKELIARYQPRTKIGKAIKEVLGLPDDEIVSMNTAEKQRVHRIIKEVEKVFYTRKREELGYGLR